MNTNLENLKCLHILEYDQIKNQLLNDIKTYIGKEKMLGLLPSFEEGKVNDLLSQTTEAINLIYRKGNIPLSDIFNISLWIKQLESFSTLSAKALLEIASILKVSRELKDYLFSDESFDISSFPIISEYFNCIYTNKGIEEKILSIIIDENTISDNASSKLSSLRRQNKRLEQEVKDKLYSFIHSSTYSKYIMDPIITIRNDRYVIPIKEEYKNSVKGFIHDVSSSGSTVFIEPISVFNLNNDIANVKAEENIEIEKILQNLSSLLYDYSENLLSNLNIIGELDVIFAKACYSISIDATLPIINHDKYISLKQARHPLIQKEQVVPINLSIGKDFSSLVITGPNTGGKTVTLKTVGLILLMAYSGLYIPAKENSQIYIFDHIFADIGDEQSIQESLSTFSSHMSNIIQITNEATQNSLILLDELGSGTDPIEGANLAISILEYFYQLGTLSISTTHYQELKNYCLTTQGFENASCEFDIEKLQPTYKLLIGIPGKSNAFAISKKLGLKKEILDKASCYIKEEDHSIEELMKSIYDDKITIEKEKEEILKNSNQIEILRKDLEKQKQIQKEKQDSMIEKSKIEARDILLSAKEEANDIIRQLNQIEEKYKEHLLSIDSEDMHTINSLRNNLNLKLRDINSQASKDTLNLDVLKNLNTKTQMKKNTLDNSKKKISHSSVTFSKNNISKSQSISTELNVIGLNVDEATFLIDKYLDDCAIAKISPVRIVHGKGTGKLRQGIHTFLKSNSHVKSYRLGTFGEGEMGVTVIELK